MQKRESWEAQSEEGREGKAGAEGRVGAGFELVVVQVGGGRGCLKRHSGSQSLREEARRPYYCNRNREASCTESGILHREMQRVEIV